MIPLALVALVLARPPVAYVDTGVKHVPLTLSSWCWAAHCSAPIARSRRVIGVRAGATLRIHLAFAPTSIALSVGGAPAKWKLSGHDITWVPKHAGGLSLTATGVSGFVTYVGRVAIRP